MRTALRALPGSFVCWAKEPLDAFGSVSMTNSSGTWRSRCLSPSVSRKPEDAELYLAEARMVASLDHPHIVAVHDVGRTDGGSVYVVSKFIEGSNLADAVDEQRLTFIEAAQLLAVVAPRAPPCSRAATDPSRYQAGQHSDRSEGRGRLSWPTSGWQSAKTISAGETSPARRPI